MKNVLLVFAVACYATAFACDGHTHNHAPVNNTNMGQKVAVPETGLKANWNETQITLSDGRVFNIKKVPQKYVSTQLVMANPDGATVVVQYEDGTNEYSAKVPFVYNVPMAKNNEYFKLTVNEGGPDKTWSVNLQAESNFVVTIEPAQ